MGYFPRHTFNLTTIQRMGELAGLRYMEKYGPEDLDVSLNEVEETIVVEGKYRMEFVFGEFI